MGFLVIVTLNSLGLVPDPVQTALGDAFRWCTVTSITALGVKRSLAEAVRNAIGLMLAETVFIGAVGLVLLHP